MTLTSLAALRGLADEWEDLYRRCPTATPFQSHGWVCSYAAAYDQSAALRVVCVHTSDRLAAAAPLRLVRRGGWSALTPIAAEISDFADVLIDPAVPAAGEYLVSTLLRLPDWDVLDAAEVPPHAALRSLVPLWPGQLLGRPSSICLELPVRPVDELAESLRSRHRKGQRRALRRIDTLDLRTDPVPPRPAPITAAVGELLDLHARQWTGRAVNPEHLTDRFRAHLTAAAQALVPTGRAVLLRTTLDGSVVAVAMTLLTADVVGGYLYGVAPDLRARIDVLSLMLRTGLDLGLVHGASRFSLLRGDEESKRRWQPTERRNQRILLLRPLRGRAVGGGLALLLRGAAEDRVHQSAQATNAARWLRLRWRAVLAPPPAASRPAVGDPARPDARSAEEDL